MDNQNKFACPCGQFLPSTCLAFGHSPRKPASCRRSPDGRRGDAAEEWGASVRYCIKQHHTIDGLMESNMMLKGADLDLKVTRVRNGWMWPVLLINMDKIMESEGKTGLNAPFNEVRHIFHILRSGHLVEWQCQALMLSGRLWIWESLWSCDIFDGWQWCVWIHRL
jgi:hypothetical protein